LYEEIFSRKEDTLVTDIWVRMEENLRRLRKAIQEINERGIFNV
jgi:hypothetical protein